MAMASTGRERPEQLVPWSDIGGPDRATPRAGKEGSEHPLPCRGNGGPEEARPSAKVAEPTTEAPIRLTESPK